MWELHKAEEEWGFLLIDARNAFNEMNRTIMLWTVQHEVSPRETHFLCLLMAFDYFLSFVLSRMLIQQWCRLGTRMMRVQPASSMLSSNSLQSYKRSDDTTAITLSPRREFLLYLRRTLPLQQQHSRDLTLLLPRATAILAVSLVRRILVVAGFRRKSNVGRKGSRRLPLWQTPTHILPMQVCRRRCSSNGSLYREWLKE
jgi:hypothetical protein